MVRIVDDLLDVSRITQGKVELRKERLELGDVWSTRRSSSAGRRSTPRSHTLTISLPDETVTLDGDAVRLTQVLVNLLNNAIKFTPPGGHIWLIAETIGEQADASGPAPDSHPRYRRRHRAETCCRRSSTCSCRAIVSLERTRAGLGVGLTLVRNLVALHGGTVDVRSDGEGAGSEFTVCSADRSAGAASRATADRPSTTRRPSRPLRILVADDNDDGREMLAYLLTAEGHTVAQADRWSGGGRRPRHRFIPTSPFSTSACRA